MGIIMIKFAFAGNHRTSCHELLRDCHYQFHIKDFSIVVVVAWKIQSLVLLRFEIV